MEQGSSPNSFVDSIRTSKRPVVLLVEDSPEIVEIVQDVLAVEYDVLATGSVHGARQILKEKLVHLFLLDVELHDGSGFDFFREIQGQYRAPVIFLTGRSDLEDKLLGFDLGAADYITKPFNPKELRVRVRAHLRTLDFSDDVLVIQNLKIDKSVQRAFMMSDGREIDFDLTPIEFKILYLLVRHRDKIVDRDTILRAVWGGRVHVLERTIDKHISSLRQKLGTMEDLVQTVPQAGYRFTPLVQKAT